MLKLIRSVAFTNRGVVSPGSGWVNVERHSGSSLTPYWHSGGLMLVTATAWNCDGLKLIHWGGDGEITSATSGKNHTISAVMDFTFGSSVVRVLNPTDKTKVIVNMQPLSLSLPHRIRRRVAKAVAAWR